MVAKRKYTDTILIVSTEGKDTKGFHYVIARDGDVSKGRNLDEWGSYCPTCDARSVVIGVEGKPNEAQEAAINGLVSYLQEKYPEADVIELTEV